MTSDKITPRVFEAILPRICDRDTAFDSKSWSLENPLWGHCAIISVLAQNLFGGDILFGKNGDVRHYWNRMTNGLEKDFTIAQFRGRQLKLSSVRRVTNSLQHLRIKGSKRYKLFASRFTKEMAEVRS